jgi:hypothetical protein
MSFSSLGALEALCAICIFLCSIDWHASGFFIALLIILDYFILSVSKCGCYPNEDGCIYNIIHRTDDNCKYQGKRPVPNTYGLAVFLNQNYNAYVVVLAICVYYFF